MRQYAATPYVTPAECVCCERPLLPRRSGLIAAGSERSDAVRLPAGGVDESASRRELRS